MMHYISVHIIMFYFRKLTHSTNKSNASFHVDEAMSIAVSSSNQLFDSTNAYGYALMHCLCALLNSYNHVLYDK